MKYCRECGCENLDEAQFCKNCGLEFISLPVSEEKQSDEVKVLVNNNQNSIISKLFYKTDKYTGQLRLAKAKSLSIGMFVVMFLFGISMGSATASSGAVFIAAILFGLLFAIPTYLVGYALGWIVDRSNN
ncbi:MAG: hypothetical protein Q4Q14_00505 [Methanobrevibacter sp.]|nr:hypothetical protein [Methanobrevibacter sp.]